MLTRCPACETAFRVTPEQLKARGGKVRCGKCQTVFNALDSLVETPLPAATATKPVAPVAPPEIADVGAAATAEAVRPPAAVAAIPAPPLPEEPQLATMPDTVAESIVLTDVPGDPDSAEAVRDAAITHGLVAARETTEIPGYNKWAEGAFSTPESLAVPPRRTVWPLVLAATLLVGALLGQAAHYFRSELVVAAPALRPLLVTACAALDCDLPLPRNTDLVSIEASDLQADPAQGGALVLAATLKNRAAYAQAWPLLELTLTDVQDSALLRRVLQPADYLPAKADPTVFPPNGEIGIRLWLEAKDIAAAGYRLYVFYP